MGNQSIVVHADREAPVGNFWLKIAKTAIKVQSAQIYRDTVHLFSNKMWARASFSNLSDAKLETIPDLKQPLITTIILGDQLFVFGNVNSIHHSESSPCLIIIDLLTCTWKKHPNTIGFFSNCSIVNFGMQLYCFGGCFDSEHFTNEITRISMYDSRVLKPLAGLPPCPRMSHAAVSYKQSMYVYGGISASKEALGDFFSFNFNTKEWRKIETKINPGIQHSCIACVACDSLFLVTNDQQLWEYVFPFKSWRVIHVPILHSLCRQIMFSQTHGLWMTTENSIEKAVHIHRAFFPPVISHQQLQFCNVIIECLR